MVLPSLNLPLRNPPGRESAMPLISAVMLVTHPKRAAMCAQACHAFVQQTYPYKELVVVNDGEPLVSVDPRVRVVQVPSGLSIGMKRNAGLLEAAGDLIAVWDDDDLSFDYRLALHLAEMQRDGRSKWHRSSRWWLGDPNLRVTGMMSHGDKARACFPTSLIDRESLLEVGGYPDISYLEDMEAFMRFSMRGIPRSESAEPLYVHRRHNNNVSSQYSAQTLQSHQREVDSDDPAVLAWANLRVNELLSRPQHPVLASANGEPLMFPAPVHPSGQTDPAVAPPPAATPVDNSLDRVAVAVENASRNLLPMLRDTLLPVILRDRELQRTVGEAAGRGLANELKPVLWFLAGTAATGVFLYWRNSRRAAPDAG